MLPYLYTPSRCIGHETFSKCTPTRNLEMTPVFVSSKYVLMKRIIYETDNMLDTIMKVTIDFVEHEYF